MRHSVHPLKWTASKNAHQGFHQKRRKQAIAIGLSEARKAGAKVPLKKAAEQVLPQSIPPGALVTAPLPLPALITANMNTGWTVVT